jgi:hypothetical protein
MQFDRELSMTVGVSQFDRLGHAQSLGEGVPSMIAGVTLKRLSE